MTRPHRYEIISLSRKNEERDGMDIVKDITKEEGDLKNNVKSEHSENCDKSVHVEAEAQVEVPKVPDWPG